MKNPSPPSWRWQAALIVLPVVVLAAVGGMGLFQIKRIIIDEATSKAQHWCDLRAQQVRTALSLALRDHPVPGTFDDPPNPPPPGQAMSVDDLDAQEQGQMMALLDFGKQGTALPPKVTTGLNRLFNPKPYRTASGLPTRLLQLFDGYQHPAPEAPAEARETEAFIIRRYALFDEACVLSPLILATLDPTNKTGWKATWNHTQRAQHLLRHGELPTRAFDSWVLMAEPDVPDRERSTNDPFWLIGRGQEADRQMTFGSRTNGLSLIDSTLIEQVVTATLREHPAGPESTVTVEKVKHRTLPELEICERSPAMESIAISIRLGPSARGSTPFPFLGTGSVLAAVEGIPQVVATLEDSSPWQMRWRLWTSAFATLLAVSILSALTGLWMLRRTILRERALSDMKTNFIASVTHELRAPVASLQLLSEGLEAGTVSDETKRRDYFRLMAEECRRLGGLIANVLDLSRIERGSREFRFEECDLHALVLDTVKLHEPRASSLGITLQTEAADLDPPAVVDAMAMQQALTNLIDNALKFAPRDSTVLVTLSQPDPQHWRLCVQDGGPGVPESERERIFDAFHRIGSELRRETQGVGIGLAIVKHIVEAHRGKVWVEGEPTRFIIECPGRGIPMTKSECG